MQEADAEEEYEEEEGYAEYDEAMDAEDAHPDDRNVSQVGGRQPPENEDEEDDFGSEGSYDQ